MTLPAGPDQEDAVQVVGRSDVRRLLDWPSLLVATRDALVQLSSGTPLPGISNQLVVRASALHLKAGALNSPPIMTVKANLRPDQGSASGAILVFDYEQQCLRAIVSSTDLTAMRTAAIAAVAATTLLTDPTPVVAILGAGSVARFTDEVLAHLGMPKEVRIWSRSRDRAYDLIEAAPTTVFRKVFGTVAEAVAGADLVISCTPARQPIVEKNELKDAAVVLAMGADSKGKRELGDAILTDADLYADVLDDARRVGEIAYLPSDHSERVIELGVVIREGLRPNQEASGRLVVFDSVGSSAVDAAATALLLDRTRGDREGIRLHLER